nr:hypothetical protein BaRGS_003605 [Batillaria attramentaria]
MICARTVPTLNFNRSWQDYKNGFGSFSSNDFNHWLGLEKVHLLTNNRAYQLRFSMSIQNNTLYFGVYPNFVVSSEASGYAFSLSTPPDFPLLDCLSPLEGAPFSTYDNDNDGETSVNCAQRHGGGFWFKGPECSTICNVFGQLLQPADDSRSGIPDEVFWSMRYVAVELAPKKMFLYLISK